MEVFSIQKGKYLKVFGPDDNNGLKLLKGKVDIIFKFDNMRSSRSSFIN